MVTPVVWNKPDIENSVPLWIIILAILAGLLLLALLIYVLYKVSEIRTLKFLHDVILLSERVIKTEIKSNSFLICAFLKSSSVVRLLQAISTLRHSHGESTTQTTGRVRGLGDNRKLPEPKYLAV